MRKERGIAMEPEINCKDDADMGEGVTFSQVSTVVTGWTLDFLFASLCRLFKEGKLDEFDRTLTTLEAVSQSPALNKDVHTKKILIVAFLTRVMHGKQMDVQYDEDSSVMPLMSAAKLWLGLKSTVADEKLFNDITILLLSQAVAVCLEKGDSSSAYSALNWVKEEQQFPEGLIFKLTTVVKKGDAYHPLLMSFSYSRLLETAQSYIDAYLQSNPSDYLIKAATEVLKSSGKQETTQDSVPSKPGNTSTEKTEENVEKRSTRAKQKLLSKTLNEFWSRESCKKPFITLRRMTPNELSQTNMVRKSPVKTAKCESNLKKRKKPEKWTPELDRFLKEGVRQHGAGKWARILLDYDFEGRTGTMLKDRWRTLTKGRVKILC